MREVFPAGMGYHVTVEGELYSYDRTNEWEGVKLSEGWRYTVSVWRGDWHFNTNDLRFAPEAMDEPQTVAEAVERLLRVLPFVPAVRDERPMFRREEAA